MTSSGRGRTAGAAFRTHVVRAALVAALSASAAHASTVYDSGVGVAQVTHGGYSCTDCPGSFETADRFVLRATTPITDVHWWGMYFNESSNQTDAFSIRFYLDDPTNPGLPSPVGTEIFAADVGDGGRVATGSVVGGGGIMDGLPIFAYSVFLPAPFAAQAGTLYWLSIVNTAARGWVWALQDTSAHYIAQSTSGTPVFDAVYPARAAFQLTDDAAVPEPATLGLFGTGLVGLVLARRRRTREARD